MRMRSLGRALVTLSAAAVLTIGVAIPSHATQPTPETDDGFELKHTESAAEAETTPELGDAQSAIDALVLPPVTAEMLDAANSVREKFIGDPRFSDVEIARDRSALTVWWDGEAPPELKDLIATTSVHVNVAKTTLNPGKLREAVQIAVSDPSLGIASAGPKLDGSGIEVTLTAGFERTHAPKQPSLGESLGVPVEVLDEPAPTPLRRQNDYWGLGGARVYQWSGSSLTNGCTTGFAVQKGTTVGVMFAAHCGLNGAQFVRWPDNTGTSVYAYAGNGAITSRSNQHDAAIMTTNSHMGAIYTHAWNNTAANAMAINGVQDPIPGAELCFSGSYSGFVCGNVVESNGHSYTLQVAGTTTPVNVTAGTKTVQALGTSSVGQGDSGGPGVLPAMVNGSPAILASTIISAGPNNNEPCTGVQGRICSSTAYSTSVHGALAYTGWSIKTG